MIKQLRQTSTLIERVPAKTTEQLQSIAILFANDYEVMNDRRGYEHSLSNCFSFALGSFASA